MANALQCIEMPREEMLRFCERHRRRKLSLYGSILRDRFRPERDVDVLVEFEPDAVITYVDVARIERELSEFLGRKADVRTPQELSRYFRDRIVAEAVLQYERK